MAGEGTIKRFWRTFLVSFGFSPAVDELSFNNPQDLEAALRRRAFVCRRQSGIFLLAILLMICVAFYVTLLGLLRIETAQNVIFRDFKKEFEDQQTKTADQINKLEQDLKKDSVSLRQYMSGFGVTWEELPWQDEIRKKGGSERVGNIKQLPSGVLIAEGRPKIGQAQIWRSEDAGKTWKPGQLIKGEDFYFSGFGQFENRLVFNKLKRGDTSSRKGALYVTDDYGESYKVINLPAFKTTDCNGDTMRSRLGGSELIIEVIQCEDLATEFRFVYLDRLKAEIIEAPRKLGRIQTVKINKRDVIEVLASDKTNEDQFILWTLSAKGWQSKTVPFSSPLMTLVGDWFLSVRSELEKQQLLVTVWDPQTGKNVVIPFNQNQANLPEDDWIRALRSIDQLEKKKKENLWLETKKMRDTTFFAYIASRSQSGKYERFNFTFLVRMEGLLKESVRLLRGYPVGNEGAYLRVQTKKGREIRAVDIKSGQILAQIEEPLNLKGTIKQVKRKENEWLLLVLPPRSQEQRLAIYSKRGTNPVWSKRQTPEKLTLGQRGVRWDVFRTPQDEIIIGLKRFIDNELLLRTRYYDLQGAISAVLRALEARKETELSNLQEFIKKADPPSLRDWPNYDLFSDRLEKYITLKKTNIDIKKKLNKLPKFDENKAQGTSHRGQIRFSFEFIILLLAQFLIIGIIFFAIRILINLYRYFLRLASFYEARADGLTLILANNERVDKFLPKEASQIFKAVSPDDHDFGSIPKTPVDQVVEAATQMAKEAAEVVKKAKD